MGRRDDRPDETGSTNSLEVAIKSIRPVQLSIWNIGPFNDPDGYRITFLGPRRPSGQGAENLQSPPADPIEVVRDFAARTHGPIDGDTAREPCNLWIGQGAAGSGKTTIAECIYGLFDLTSVRPQGLFGWHADGAAYGGVAQIDLLVRMTAGGVGRSVLFSIWYGPEEPPVEWRTKIAGQRPWLATEWASLGFVAGRTSPAYGTNDLGRLILRAIRLREGASNFSFSPTATGGSSPYALVEGLRALPTALLFGAGPKVAGRRISPGEAFLEGGYRPAKRLDPADEPADGVPRALRALDADPCWRFHVDEVLRHLETVAPLEAGGSKRLSSSAWEDDAVLIAVRRDRTVHPVATLGDGERAQVSLHLQTFVSMTEATLLIIDGIDRDLEPGRYPAALASLKRLALRFPGMSIIAMVRDPAFLKAYDHHSPEAGLVKGGERLDAGQL